MAAWWKSPSWGEGSGPSSGIKSSCTFVSGEMEISEAPGQLESWCYLLCQCIPSSSCPLPFVRATCVHASRYGFKTSLFVAGYIVANPLRIRSTSLRFIPSNLLIFFFSDLFGVLRSRNLQYFNFKWRLPRCKKVYRTSSILLSLWRAWSFVPPSSKMHKS